MTERKNLWLGIIAALLAALIGSAWQLTSRYGVTTSLGAMELACLRYGVPALVLLPLLLKTGLLLKSNSVLDSESIVRMPGELPGLI